MNYLTYIKVKEYFEKDLSMDILVSDDIETNDNEIVFKNNKNHSLDIVNDYLNNEFGDAFNAHICKYGDLMVILFDTLNN